MWVWGVSGGLLILGLIMGALLWNRATKGRCPNCRALIPKSATTCPHCTDQLQEYFQEAGKEEPHPQEKQDT